METYKKRQKELARKEKQRMKAARKLERRNEKENSPNSAEESDSTTTEPIEPQGPTL